MSLCLASTTRPKVPALMSLTLTYLLAELGPGAEDALSATEPGMQNISDQGGPHSSLPQHSFGIEETLIAQGESAQQAAEHAQKCQVDKLLASWD